LENFFEPRDEDGYEVMREGCGGMCAYCTNEYSGFTEQFSRDGLVRVLLSFVFADGPPSLKDFIKRMSENVLMIYSEDDKVMLKRLSAGNIHALGLQLVAARIVEIHVNNEKLIGTDKSTKNNLVVNMAKESDGKGTAFDDFNCR